MEVAKLISKVSPIRSCLFAINNLFTINNFCHQRFVCHQQKKIVQCRPRQTLLNLRLKILDLENKIKQLEIKIENGAKKHLKKTPS